MTLISIRAAAQRLRTIGLGGVAMPYVTDADLPASVREHLPPHAQEIFRAAYNHAWEQYADHSDREAVCNRVAWAAVKRKYHEIDDTWVSLNEY